jgi:RNA polymerase sigma-70 factor, ECF subfamily
MIAWPFDKENSHFSAFELTEFSSYFSGTERGASSVNLGSHPRPGATSPSLATLKGLTDNRLMLQLEVGANDALVVLFERYHRLVLSIAARIIRDHDQADEVTQKVFLNIYWSVAQFDSAKGNFKLWLLQYAYHLSFNCRQYLNAKSFYSELSIEDLDHFSNNGFFTSGQFGPKGRLLREGLASLGTPQRRAIKLSSYEGLSIEDIAGKTGESISTVRRHYYLGLQRLRSVITQSPVAGIVVGNYE